MTFVIHNAQKFNSLIRDGVAFYLHGLNAVHLPEFGWPGIDLSNSVACGTQRKAANQERSLMQHSEYMAMMQGDDGALGNAELVAAYEQGVDDLRSAVAGMTPEQVLARPVPGMWSTVECVGHIADTGNADCRAAFCTRSEGIYRVSSTSRAFSNTGASALADVAADRYRLGGIV